MPGTHADFGQSPTESTGAAGSLPSYQTAATAASAHEMIVALGIFAAVGMVLVILAGESTSAGNGIAVVLGIMLLAQGLFHINPVVSFITAHPLTPSQS